jgi:hypothetical protein
MFEVSQRIESLIAEMANVPLPQSVRDATILKTIRIANGVIRGKRRMDLPRHREPFWVLHYQCHWADS